MTVDWQAKWIWARGYLETPNCYVYARRQFEARAISAASVLVTCSSEYKLYINGRYVGRGPGPCRPTYQYYDQHDVKHVIRSGKNVVAVLCYNYGVDTGFRPRTPGGLLLRMCLTRAGADEIVIATDHEWRVWPGEDFDFGSARMSDTAGFQEVYDSRRKPVGWNVVGFDDEDWRPPEVIGEAGVEPWTSLVPRPIPRLRERELFAERVVRCGVVAALDEPGLDVASRIQRGKHHPDPNAVKHPDAALRASSQVAEVAPGADAFVVVDFGCEVVGFPTIRFRDAGVGTVDIGYSEALDDNGDVAIMRQGILQADRVILHGGRQEWQSFGRRAFRYLQLTFRDIDAPLHLESVSVNSVGYPVEQVSTFECSDENIDRVWQAGLRTLSACMQDCYESSPLNGRGKCAGDIRVQALTNYCSFLDSKLVAKTLAEMAHGEPEDGWFAGARPPFADDMRSETSLLWVIALHDYYLHVGDRTLVERLYPNVRLLMERCVDARESENGLLVGDPGRESCAQSALYYQALRDAAKLASAVGSIEDAVRWHDTAEGVLAAYNSVFWSEARGAYADGEVVDVVSNALAVLFGLADYRRCELISSLFKSRADATGSVGPVRAFYLLHAMARLEMGEEAVGLIREIWGGMLQRGATTWWEDFDPSWPEQVICPGGLCHSPSGGPTCFLPSEVLGVKPSMPESSVVLIQPSVGGLEWARGRVAMHGQTVEVEWRSAPGSFTIDITAPEGFIVALPVAGFRNPLVEEIDTGPETPERRARRTYGWGNVIWSDGEERDPYLDWLDSQDESPPPLYSSRWRCTLEDRRIWVRECVLSQVRYIVRESSL